MSFADGRSQRAGLLISQLIDGELSADEVDELSQLALADARIMESIVDQCVLDTLFREELGCESLVALVDMLVDRPATPVPAVSKRRALPKVNWFSVFAAACSLLVGTMLVWKFLGDTHASAAVTELNRIIAKNMYLKDRTYRITVEESLPYERSAEESKVPVPVRPPKPPMDGAILHVSGGRRFVLERRAENGLPFVNGSNGRTSWAARADGSVCVSADPTRFSHDLPGHEHAMPLINIQEGLERLSEAYHVEILPAKDHAGEADVGDDPSRMIVAVKKPNYRGPMQVEITYSVSSGVIRQMRFVKMPYGPLQRLTLRMTLVEERPLGELFFEHESHHAADSAVEFEE